MINRYANRHAATPIRLGTGIGKSVLDRRAAAGLCRAERAGAILYDRRRDLARLIHLDPFEPMPADRAASEAILARLRSALRAERNRGRAGHWTYDLNRHIALRQAYAAELARTPSPGSAASSSAPIAPPV